MPLLLFLTGKAQKPVLTVLFLLLMFKYLKKIFEKKQNKTKQLKTYQYFLKIFQRDTRTFLKKHFCIIIVCCIESLILVLKHKKLFKHFNLI